MGTEIKVWQIVNDNLKPIETTMIMAGRNEVEHLQGWIRSNPKILGEDILLIGERVRTTTGGEIDFLGIDRSGNLIIIELKRDMLPREALAQAIDYASDVSSWSIEKIREVCKEYTRQELEDYLNENMEGIDLEDLMINESQRILFVGFSVEEPLQRMIEWLSNNYDVSINVVILKYIKTKNGEELIARTVIIPEEVERERAERRQRRISISDEPGNYNNEELRSLLVRYLSENRLTPRRIREILLPLCLENTVVTRQMIIMELINRGEAHDEGRAGTILTTISREIGIRKRDYLRQIIRYDRPNPWERDNYRLVESYRNLVQEVLSELDRQERRGER